MYTPVLRVCPPSSHAMPQPRTAGHRASGSRGLVERHQTLLTPVGGPERQIEVKVLEPANLWGMMVIS